MSRDYEHVDFRPWYVPDTAGWLSLSLGARGLAAELLRKFDRKGQLRIRRLEDLCILLRLSWQEVEPAIHELLKANRVGWDESTGLLFDPDFTTRMRVGSAARMHRKRQRESGDVTDVTDVTPVTVSDASDTKHTCDVTSDLILSDLIFSKSGSGSEEIQSAREAPPPESPQNASETLKATHVANGSQKPVLGHPRSSNGPSQVRPELTGPPAWFEAAISTVETATGEMLRPADSWLRYSGHRANKGVPTSQQDAVYWLTTVMVPEARRERRAESDKRERDRQRAGGPGSANEPRIETEAERQANAERFARRLRESKEKATKGAA